MRFFMDQLAFNFRGQVKETTHSDAWDGVGQGTGLGEQPGIHPRAKVAEVRFAVVELIEQLAGRHAIDHADHPDNRPERKVAHALDAGGGEAVAEGLLPVAFALRLAEPAAGMDRQKTAVPRRPAAGLDALEAVHDQAGPRLQN
jgi:hypothetical protein